MDDERARQLLGAERRRLTEMRAGLSTDLAGVVGTEPAELSDGAERETDEETDQALIELATQRWAALERAEARLAQGTYGRSVRSGAPIPDERLEADPLAELTVEEAASGADEPIG